VDMDNYKSLGKAIDIKNIINQKWDYGATKFREILLLRTNYLKNYRGIMLDMGLEKYMF
jgi:hypothetical protein